METFALTNGQWGGLYAAGTTCSGMLMIWAGGFADRWRVRVLAPILLVVLCAFCFAMGANTAAWVLPFIIFGLRFGGQGMMSHLAMVGLARWFSRARGRAIAIAGLGFSIGEAFLPLIIVSAMAVVGWQQIWLIAGLAALALIPVLRWLLRTERTPQEIAKISEERGMNNVFWTRPDALKHWLFWAITPTAITTSVFVTAMFFQQVHLAEVKGWGHARLVALFPIYTGTAISAMMFFGWAIDRYGAARLMPVFQIPMAFGLVILGTSASFTSAAIGLLLIAVSQGGYNTISVAFWAEVYGTRYMGAIRATASALTVLGSALGPWMTGSLIDLGYDFPTQMPFYAAYILAACVLTYFACRAVRPRLASAA